MKDTNRQFFCLRYLLTGYGTADDAFKEMEGERVGVKIIRCNRCLGEAKFTRQVVIGGSSDHQDMVVFTGIDFPPETEACSLPVREYAEALLREKLPQHEATEDWMREVSGVLEDGRIREIIKEVEGR